MIKAIIILILYISFNFLGCSNKPRRCDQVYLIENKWSDINGGEYELTPNKKDAEFICDQINHFPEGKLINVSDHYGYLTICTNKKKYDMIFSAKKGIVYGVSPGKFVYDEALTQKIMILMKIRSRKWR